LTSKQSKSKTKAIKDEGILNWNSALTRLVSSKSKTIEKLVSSGYTQLKDLLWILPLKTQVHPPVNHYAYASDESLFQGIGKVLNIQHKPNFKSKGRGRTPLANLTLIVQDAFSNGTLTLKWFNCYPSQVKALKSLEYIHFSGQVSSYMGQVQLISPDFHEITIEEFSKSKDYWSDLHQISLKVQYPTVNGISPHLLLGVFNKIPESLWKSLHDYLPQSFREDRDLLPLGEAFRRVHGKCSIELATGNELEKAHNRLIYEEFFREQIMLILRKKHQHRIKGIQFKSNNWEPYLNLFPYTLTDDQKSTMKEVASDLSSGHPMMRLVQGDVGSGKTTIAFLSSFLAKDSGYQSALMCPTESLALQHYLSAKELFGEKIKIDLLVGSLTKKEKEQVVYKLIQNETDLVIGTHALIQDSVSFKNLGLVIIDEQHKFGVEQRLKLVNKGKGTHCLIMTATPIPRSLSLTQYGDLDVSIIKSIPSDRKGTQTRIVGPPTYQKYLSFFKTRISMGEQAYVVVPAIEENEEQDILNLEIVLKKYKEYFPDFRIIGLHGKMKANEKNDAFISFRNKEVDIMISTSVIEVGINNPNATIMAILNPERFGLSSLHQMRGRVGRGNKPGFCFLVNDKQISPTSMERLNIIEKNSDGFKIAEEDLRIRGEGNLFGKEQSGIRPTKVLASLILHQETLEWAREDVEKLSENYPEVFAQLSEELGKDDILYKTV
tara:strand:- start:129525 stop:131681 length:2157 start_codon:yes stop_codon:yes gene_type:complete